MPKIILCAIASLTGLNLAQAQYYTPSYSSFYSQNQPSTSELNRRIDELEEQMKREKEKERLERYNRQMEEQYRRQVEATERANREYREQLQRHHSFGRR